MTWKIKPSKIHGVGIFTTRNINIDEYIDTAILKNQTITLFGSKINHSWTPNTRLVYDSFNKTYDIHANKNIPINTELTVDYTFTPPFIRKPFKSWL